MSNSVSIYTRKYETVAASQTAQVLGASGKTGDKIEKLIVTVATAATSTVSLLDNTGGSLITIPIAAANTPIGVYVVDFGPGGIAATSGGWKITTGAGATVLAIGQFS